MTLKTELLKTSFALLRDRQTDFTDCFYTMLFSDYPQVKPLFSHTKMDEQAKKLFASLALIVNNLTKPNVLTDALKGLGAGHLKYGVLPEHYPMVGGALIKSMAATLEEHWTTDHADAWTEAYAAITEIMLDGADHPPEASNPVSPTPALSA